MTGPEHYAVAEELLEMAGENPASVEDAYVHEHYLLAKAQVHATLAAAAATAASINKLATDLDILSAWRKAGVW